MTGVCMYIQVQADEQRLFELFLNNNTFAVIFSDIFKFQ